ncbi:MAG: IS200/IS605 family transposase, partial [Bacteroidales bacterium]|nr:IS200/IS605 family transposase [Bacteroidales bacterium]
MPRPIAAGIQTIISYQNHVHLFCGVQPSISPIRVVSIIKSITVRRVFSMFPKIKHEELWGREFWSDGHYIGTVGEANNEEVIKRYIRN